MVKRIFISILAGLGAIVATVAPVYASDATKVSVTLWDAGADMTMVANMRIKDHSDKSKAPMGIKLSGTTIAPGEVTFNVTNASANIEHEMVVAKLDDETKGLIYNEDAGEVDEDKPGMNLGEVPELAVGKSGSLTLHLKPGKYVLYCNVAGHYASGMWTIITVG